MILAPVDEIAELFGSGDAVAVRRWDDQAKGPSAQVPGFGHYRPLLEELLAS